MGYVKKYITKTVKFKKISKNKCQHLKNSTWETSDYSKQKPIGRIYALAYRKEITRRNEKL